MGRRPLVHPVRPFSAFPDPFGRPRARGHRIVGPLSPHAQERHWAIAAVVATVVAAAVSAYGAYEAGQQQQQEAQYRSKVAKNQAEQAKEAASVAEQNRREDDRRIMATQRAAIGGAGLSTEGTPLFVLLDTAEQSQLDALRIRYGGASTAAGLTDEAKHLIYQGDQYAKAGYIGAGTTLLTGASSATGAYARSQRNQPTQTAVTYRP